MSVSRIARPYRTRKGVVGLSYDPKTQLARMSAYVPGSGGRERKRETVFAATYDDAVRLWTEFRERVKNQHARPAVAPFFSDYIADYFDDIAAMVSAVTARDYRYAIDKHLLPFFGNRRLNEITTTVVKSFQTKLHRSGYALATVNGYLNVLLMLLHRAVDDFDLIEDFPLKKRLKRKRPEALALELNDEELALHEGAAVRWHDAAGRRCCAYDVLAVSVSEASFHRRDRDRLAARRSPSVEVACRRFRESVDSHRDAQDEAPGYDPDLIRVLRGFAYVSQSRR